MQEFAEHVRRHRGNPPRTIQTKVYRVMRFLAFLRSRGRSVARLSVSDVDAFILRLRPQYSRTVVSNYCSSLRSFARFLHATGRLPADLAPSIEAPKVSRQSAPTARCRGVRSSASYRRLTIRHAADAVTMHFF
jgi:integrase/recombinase XerD